MLALALNYSDPSSIGWHCIVHHNIPNAMYLSRVPPPKLHSSHSGSTAHDTRLETVALGAVGDMPQFILVWSVL